jgi:hypothetical protein
MRAMMTCFLVALASKRVMFIDWDHQYTFFAPEEHQDMPGGQPAKLNQVALFVTVLAEDARVSA